MNTPRHVLGALRGRIGGLVDTFDQYRRYHRTLEELNRLTDREVADLGVDRSRFPGIARESAGWS
jgi:uncharacterized protein YjiS (DUF1127 family)